MSDVAHLTRRNFARTLLACTALPFSMKQAFAQQGETADVLSDGIKDARSLDLTSYAVTFEDNFDTLSIGADGDTARWFSGIHAPFGSAQFVAPSKDGPFLAENGLLTIRATKDGKWRSGMMQSADSHGHGFAQQYGYFEMRAKFPSGAATWPGFWLVGQNSLTDPKAPRVEIDIVEGYGDQPDVVHTSVHLRRYNDRHWFLSRQFKVPGMAADFHRYGVLIDPSWVIFYVDGGEIYRFPTLEQYKTTFYMLVDLGMTEGKSLARATSPSDMIVDYVRVYADKTPH